LSQENISLKNQERIEQICSRLRTNPLDKLDPRRNRFDPRSDRDGPIAILLDRRENRIDPREDRLGPRAILLDRRANRFNPLKDDILFQKCESH